ncbi:MAG TPA: hypothetical protein PLX23_07290 [Candidatus Hydrogenedens sp.]|nr:hypothetical protein [Candidatus Hydrogenedens sp.]
MQDSFAIEVGLKQGEEKDYIEKLRNFFMNKGFIVEREWEGEIEFSRLIPSKGKRETVMYPFIDKIHLQLLEDKVMVNCSTKSYVLIRSLLLYFSPTVDIIVLILLWFFIKQKVLLLTIFLFMLLGYILFYFILNMQYKQMVNSLAEEVQNL